MNLSLGYLGRSGLAVHGDAAQLSFAPNLCREPVAFDAALRQPLRFREAISALHDVVVCDLRVAKPDRTAWRQWRTGQQSREQQIRREAHAAAKQQGDAAVGITPELRREFGKATKRYWQLRDQYSKLLLREDPELARIPVLVVTGHEEAVPDMRAQLGEDNVFLKPFAVGELLARVGAVTGCP